MSIWRYEPPRMQDLGGERFLLAAVRFWESGILELERSRIKLLARPRGYRSLSTALPQAQANYRFFLDRLRAVRGLAPLFAVANDEAMAAD